MCSSNKCNALHGLNRLCSVYSSLSTQNSPLQICSQIFRTTEIGTLWWLLRNVDLYCLLSHPGLESLDYLQFGRPICAFTLTWLILRKVTSIFLHYICSLRWRSEAHTLPPFFCKHKSGPYMILSTLFTRKLHRNNVFITLFPITCIFWQLSIM